MPHPKEILDRSSVDKLRQQSAKLEELKSLSPAVLAEIYEQDWFRLLVPRLAGGREYPLPKVVAIFEALAWADGNVGWCVNLGAGANMFAGYFDSAIARSVFNSPETCCAGSGAKSGTAQKVEGGYKVTGQWKYSSGANHATHFTANANLRDSSGEPAMEDGKQAFRSFLFPASSVHNGHNWKSIGLQATSSNDISVENVFVPDKHVFSLTRPSPFAVGPVYKFPFDTMAVVCMTAMATGMALHFEDLYTTLATAKKPYTQSKTLAENPKVQKITGPVCSEFHEARENVYAQLHKVWEFYEHNEEAPQEQLDKLTDDCRKAAACVRVLVSTLYPLFGMSILDPDCEANRVWRDVSTASQHYLLSPLA